MVLVEAARDSTIYSETQREANLSQSPLPPEGILIEFPLIPRDPIDFTREEFLNLPDGVSRREVLIELRRDPYDPIKIAKAVDLFPEGYSNPLSEIEKRVFASMSHVMASEDKLVLDQDRSILGEHLHLDGRSVEDAITQLQEEGDHRREGHFWPTKFNIGGYELNRLIASEIDNQAEIENKIDEAKLYCLEDMERVLSNQNIPVRHVDQEEIERLRQEMNKRRANKQAFFDRARNQGYSNLRIH